MSGIIIFLVFSGISAILWIGGQDLLAGRISAGDLSSFVFYAFRCATGFLSELAGELQRAAGAASVRPDAAGDGELARAGHARSLHRDHDFACAFEAVDFAYPARLARPAVGQVDLVVRRGERVALVGPSTCRQIDPVPSVAAVLRPGKGCCPVVWRGSRSLALADLRSHIGLVPRSRPVLDKRS